MTLHSADLPEALVTEASGAWQHILERAGEPLAGQLSDALATGPLAAQLVRVLACSPFISDLARRKPELLLHLVHSGQLLESMAEPDFRDELQRLLGEEGAELGPVLRRYRQRHMLRIVWRDFCRLADTLETVRDTSLLAEAAIAEALAHSRAAL